MAEKDYSSLTEVTFKKKTYDLTTIPNKDSEIVQQQAKAVEEELNLKELGTDLSRLGKFVQLAYCGVVGHADLQIKVRESLCNVGNLCDDTVFTINEFKRTSQEALENMQSAYEYLEDGLEDEALDSFKDIQTASKKMSEASNRLSQKCVAERENIKEVGNETLVKKDEVEEEKIKTETSLLLNQADKVVNESAVEETSKEVAEKKAAIKTTYSSEDEIFKKKSDVKHELEKELDEQRNNFKEKRGEIKAIYEEVNKDVAEELGKNLQKLENVCSENTNEYLRKQQEIEKSFRTKIESAEMDYKRQIADNKAAMLKQRDQNRADYDNAIRRNQSKYDEQARAIEETCKFEVRESESKLQNELRKNADELSRKIEFNKKQEDITLATHQSKSEYTKKGGWFSSDKTVTNTSVKSQLDAKEKGKAATADSNDKQCKNQSDLYAKNTKLAEVQAANSKKDREQNLALQDKDKSNDQAVEARKYADRAAEEKNTVGDKEANTAKEYQLQKAKSELKDEELAAKQQREDEDTRAKAEHEKQNELSQKKREANHKKYRDDLQQLKEDEEKAENIIINKLESELKLLDGEFEELQKRLSSHESKVQDLQQQKQEAFAQLQKLAVEIASSKDQIQIKKTSMECLHEAVGALRKIEVMMRQLGNFWTEVESLCVKVTDNKLNTQVSKLQGMEDSERQKIWKSKAFKNSALRFYGKWVALKGVFVVSGKYIKYSQREIHQYIGTNPSTEEANKIVQVLAKEISGMKAIEQPSEETIEQPSEETIEQPSEETIKQPSEETIEQPSEET